MNSAVRFIVGSVITLAILIFVSIMYFGISIEPVLITSFLFVSGLVGLLFALGKRVHSGHSVLVLGIVILSVSFVVVSGSIDLTIGGETKPKLWDIPPYLFTQLLVMMGVGFIAMFLGLHITWKKT